MDILILLMILAGSGLMVWNIFRYGQFLKTDYEFEQRSAAMGSRIVPLLLLIFFLIGYVAVAVSGMADLIMASILLGGSIFVYLLLRVIFMIIDHIRDTTRILTARHAEIREEFNALTKDSMTMLRVNLTKDVIEERKGNFLFDSDLSALNYSELIQARRERVISRRFRGKEQQSFTREYLIAKYREGVPRMTEFLLVRRRDGVPSFVRFEAIMTMMPVTGDIVAFIVETPYNEEMIQQTLIEDMLMPRYDLVAYIAEGIFKNIRTNPGKIHPLLPETEEESYESIYLNYILPAMASGGPVRTGAPNPLRLSVIRERINRDGRYEVEAPFTVNGERCHMLFSFCMIEGNTDFYLMTLTDTTNLHAQQEASPAESGNTITAVPAEEEAPPEENPGAPQNADEEQAARDGGENEADRQPEGLRLLVADDNEINREIASLVLEGEGYRVDLAADGAEALEKVKNAGEGGYDAVLMDVQMPVMDGYQATAAIRSLPDSRTARIPIIAMTANAYDEDRKAAIAAGMNGYATKPINPQEIRAVLDGVTAQTGRT